MKPGSAQDLPSLNMSGVQAESFSMEIKTLAVTAGRIAIQFVHVNNVLSFTCICTRCGENFVTKSSLKSHIKTHILQSNDTPVSTLSISAVGAPVYNNRVDSSDVKDNNSNVVNNTNFDCASAVIDDARARYDEPGTVPTTGMSYGVVQIIRSMEPVIGRFGISNSCNDAEGRVMMEMPEVHMASVGDSERPDGIGLGGIDGVTSDNAETVEPSTLSIRGNSCKEILKLGQRSNRRLIETAEPSTLNIPHLNLQHVLELTENPDQGVDCTDSAKKSLVPHDKKRTNPSQTNFLLDERKQPDGKSKSKECKICGEKVCGRKNFIDHTSMHAGVKPHKCSECGDGYETKSLLKVHLRKHKRDTHNCEHCGKQFKLDSGLRRHICLHTSRKSYSCPVCAKGFDSNVRVKEHMWVHTGVKCYLCTICGKTFARFHHLRDHTLLHTGEKPHLCSICGKTFSLASGLKSHTRVHTKVKSYKCDVCGKTFSHLGNLKAHAEKHTDRYFNCSLCEKAFKYKSSLGTHVKIQHEKKYIKCKICSETFKKYDTLKTHVLRHIGEKPYSCSVCAQRFLRKSQQDDHMRKHTGEKPFECKHCGRAFRVRAKLWRHVKTQHQDQQRNTTVSSSVHSIGHSVSNTNGTDATCSIDEPTCPPGSIPLTYHPAISNSSMLEGDQISAHVSIITRDDVVNV